MSYTSSSNHPNVTFKCSKDYNRKGGALGYVECKVVGTVREKWIPPPPPPKSIQIPEEKVVVAEVSEIHEKPEYLIENKEEPMQESKQD